MSKEQEEYIIRNIMITMGIEGRELDEENISLIKKYLGKEITMEEVIELLDERFVKKV